MESQEEIRSLTKTECVIYFQQIVTVDGLQYKGESKQVVYMNTTAGRESLNNAGYGADIINAVFAMWGAIPLAEDTESTEGGESNAAENE